MSALCVSHLTVKLHGYLAGVSSEGNFYKRNETVWGKTILETVKNMYTTRCFVKVFPSVGNVG